MPNKKKLSPNKLAEVKEAFAGLKTIGDYAPLKPEFAINAIQTVETAVDALTLEEAQMSAQLAELRDQLADKGNEFAQKMKGAAQQVIAQYGDDSTELQKLGRVRSSERATRKSKKSGSQPS